MAIALVVILIAGKSFIENVDANEIKICQFINGKLVYWVSPGVKAQWFGRIDTYPKSVPVYFSAKDDEGGEENLSIKVRFADGGSAWISGSLQLDYPTDAEHLYKLRAKYSSHASVLNDLVRPVVRRSVYMAGPLMTSTESYADKRADLLNTIQDQIERGIYKTSTHEEKRPDPITGVEKTVTIVEIVKDINSPGGLARQEASPLGEFGIRPYNLSITKIEYSPVVEKQIEEQQKAKMNVQIAAAQAKEAEQRTLTVEQEGKANAAKAKWEQEIEKAREVTAAEKRVTVASLDLETARLTKQKDIALGEGEARRKQLVLDADGALTAKLETYALVQSYWADAVKNYQGQWVPAVVMGGDGTGTGTSGAANDLLDMFKVKIANDLRLDMDVKQGATVK